jgi:catalase
MGYSPDKMLQAPMIGYSNAHRYRLGVNFETLPVNRPQCPVHNYNRDGFMRADENGGDSPKLRAEQLRRARQDSPYRELPYKVSSEVNPYDHRLGHEGNPGAHRQAPDRHCAGL